MAFFKETILVRSVLIVLFIFFYSADVFACSCAFAWNDSFSRTIKNSEFVALVKIISFDKYLDEDILGHNGKMPYSMTVEIIKKYKGNEKRKKIKILGDNGMLCRPYLSYFKINSYYLVSPNALDNSANTEYDFFSCRTEYLNVDMDSNVALGNYSLIRNQINLDKFENKVKNGDWDLLLLSLILSSTILLLLFMRRNIKRKTNSSSD